MLFEHLSRKHMFHLILKVFVGSHLGYPGISLRNFNNGGSLACYCVVNLGEAC